MSSLTPAQMRTRIDEIDEVLRTGAKSITVDGITTTFDLDSLRQERQDLERKLGAVRRRPFALKPRISG